MANETETATENTLEDVLKRGIEVHYAQVMPRIGTYNVIDLKVHNVNFDRAYFTGVDVRGEKHTYLFDFKDIDKTVFFNRLDALNVVLAAEDKYKNIKVSNERLYEEY